METISQNFKNLASDFEINSIIPCAFNPLEVIAASTTLAREISGQEKPNRHDYLEAVRAYLARIPNNVQMALDTIKLDASQILNIPGLFTDHSLLSEAQRELTDAEAKVAAAEIFQGQRLAKIYRLETEVADAANELVSWDIDFDLWDDQCDAAIVESFGKPHLIGRLNSAMAQRDQTPHLRRLAPGAVAAIKQRIAAAEGELAELRAASPAAEPTSAKLIRGRQKLSSEFEEGEEPR